MLESVRVPALAISIRQPWAELILSGRKRMEVRTWVPSYRGPLWLHVGQKTADRDLESRFGLGNLFRGGFAGIIQLRAVLPLTPDRWTAWKHLHLDDGEFRSGFYAWLLSGPIRFAEPVWSPGSLQLFEPGQSVLEQLRKLLAEDFPTTREQKVTNQSIDSHGKNCCRKIYSR